jgi:hypothetical protein
LVLALARPFIAHNHKGDDDMTTTTTTKPGASLAPGALDGQQDNRGPVYLEGKEKRAVYRISSLGQCQAAVLAHLLPNDGWDGPAPIPYHQRIAMEAGHEFEEAVKGWLEQAHGVTITEEQAAVEIPVGGALLRGHIDGVAVVDARFCQNWGLDPKWAGAKLLFEAKNMGKGPFADWTVDGIGGRPEYGLQLTAYMKALGVDGALYVVGERGWTPSLGPDRLIITVITAQTPGMPSWATIAKRVIGLEKARKLGEVGCCTGSKYSCGWRGMPWCEQPSDEGKKAEAEAATVVNERADLLDLILAEREAKVAADRMAAVHKALADKLKLEIMKTSRGDRVELGSGIALRVTTSDPSVYVKRYYRRGFSASLLKADLPDVYGAEKYWTNSVVVSVVVPKVKGDSRATGEGDDQGEAAGS